MVYGMGATELAFLLPFLLFYLLPGILIVVALILVIRHFLREEKSYRSPKRVAERKSLAQVIVEHRNACHMTQEFVASELGLSRQAISKWESGTSEPSTTNLMALARLFGMEPADLLREVEG